MHVKCLENQWLNAENLDSQLQLFYQVDLALPVNFAFLRGVDLGQLYAFVVEKDLHVVEEELVRIGV